MSKHEHASSNAMLDCTNLVQYWSHVSTCCLLEIVDTGMRDVMFRLRAGLGCGFGGSDWGMLLILLCEPSSPDFILGAIMSYG